MSAKGKAIDRNNFQLNDLRIKEIYFLAKYNLILNHLIKTIIEFPSAVDMGSYYG